MSRKVYISKNNEKVFLKKNELILNDL